MCFDYVISRKRKVLCCYYVFRIESQDATVSSLTFPYRLNDPFVSSSHAIFFFGVCNTVLFEARAISRTATLYVLLCKCDRVYGVFIQKFILYNTVCTSFTHFNYCMPNGIIHQRVDVASNKLWMCVSLFFFILSFMFVIIVVFVRIFLTTSFPFNVSSFQQNAYADLLLFVWYFFIPISTCNTMDHSFENIFSSSIQLNSMHCFGLFHILTNI